MQAFHPLLATLAAYLVGSLSFAVIVSRVMGLKDPRTYGSNNPGATNVLRSGNKAAAMLTLVLDALKGFVPVALVVAYGPRWGLGEGTVAMVGLAAFLGHAWPVFFRFHGGKGVATAAGVLFGINPLLGLATLLTWLIVAAFFRYSSLAAIVAAAFAPFYQLLIWGGGPAAVAITVMGLLLIWRHDANIRKLLKGTESRLGQKSAAAVVAPSQPVPSRSRAPAPATSRTSPWTRQRSQIMSQGLRRFHVGDRLSEMTIFNGTVYLAGQVADDASQDIRGQTRQVLAAIDSLLAEAGTDNAHILMAQIFLPDLADFAGMNEVWEDWVAPGDAPPRATVQAQLAKPQWKVEIVVTAAIT